ncbi:rhodanese-like domain-containing protein [Enterococcus nangangensis]
MFSFFKRIPSITTGDLATTIKPTTILLDVRTPAEYRAGHIQQAQNVPLQKIGSYQKNLKETVYVICQSGMRSKQAAKILTKKGYPVINVRGGMNRWTGPVSGGK